MPNGQVARAGPANDQALHTPPIKSRLRPEDQDCCGKGREEAEGGEMTVTILVGDVRERLRQLPPDSFDCVVTSPPYWGLRDYGTGKWVGGDPSCDHRSPTMRDGRNEDRTKLPGSAATNSAQNILAHNSVCGKCGAAKVDQQIGLEPTMGAHIAVMVGVFREVRRVLKPSGVLFLNYGDCYATSPNGRSAADTKAAGNDDRTFRDKPFSTIGGTLKAKDLCMIPNRLAIALQDDGWWVRSEIVWAKPNPMPESIKDRPATAHEKIFMLTKSARYFYAVEEVRQGRVGDEDANTFRGGSYVGGEPGPRQVVGNKRVGKQAAIAAAANHTGIEDTPRGSRSLRNWEPAPLSAWIMGTAPFSEAHFATFPPELVERCLKAGCPKGGTVLDPFGGAGTTALVADQMQLDCTIIELNPDYVHIAAKRIEQDRGAFENLADPLLFPADEAAA
jgi:DNA modification methylase